MPVTGANIGNMNWAIVIVGAEVLFSGAYWVYAARHKYMKESPAIMDEQLEVIDSETLHVAPVDITAPKKE